MIALAFAASAAARSRSLLTRPACTAIVTPSPRGAPRCACRRDGAPVPRDELPELVDRARRVREDRLLREVPLDVLGQGRRALVAPVGLLLERLDDDRPEVGVDRIERPGGSSQIPGWPTTGTDRTLYGRLPETSS